MAEEETEPTMRFILEQQAQLTATVGRLAEKVDRTADGITALLSSAEIHEREITAVSDAQAQTDERLNALINSVERYISERRDGKS